MRRRTVLRTTGATALGIGVAGCNTTSPGDGIDDDGTDGTNGSTDDAPTYFEPLGSVSLDSAAEAVVGDDGETVYVASVDGFTAVDVADPEQPTVLAERSALLADREETFIEILDVEVSGSYLAVPGPANRRDDVFNGFVIFDVSDPADPVAVADPFETGYHIHNCYLDGNRLYVVANDAAANPLVVFEIDDEITEIGRWSLLDHDPAWTDVDWRLRYLHDVTVHDDLAVLAYWNAGTVLLDVSDPSSPQFVSRIVETDLETQLEVSDGPGPVTDHQFGLPGNDHYSAVDETGTVLAIGREAWVTDAEGADRPGGIDLYDVSDPTDPAYRSTIDAPRGADEGYYGEPWTTAHNFELRDGTLHSSWYQGGVKLHDVSDPAEPTELAAWHDPFETAFWTARVADPGETFVASSTALTTSPRPANALYTFPIRSGDQRDPVALDDPAVFDDE